MANMGTLHDAFIDELRDAYDAEKQLTKALPKMARTASSAELRRAFEMHLEETRGQVTRLEQGFTSLDEKPRGKQDQTAHETGRCGFAAEAARGRPRLQAKGPAVAQDRARNVRKVIE